MDKMIEVCVGSYKEAIIADKKGVNRIEVCDNLLEGGTTPSYGTLKMIMDNVEVRVMVIIRPRGGNFEYSNEELEIMLHDIRLCKKLNVNGVVLGCLINNKIDEVMLKRLVKEAKPMEITFHMAFDEIIDKKEAIDILIGNNIDRILTKGGNRNAIENIKELKDLIIYANDRIIVMPGKGIDTLNKQYILEKTGAKELHGTKIL